MINDNHWHAWVAYTGGYRCNICGLTRVLSFASAPNPAVSSTQEDAGWLMRRTR